MKLTARPLRHTFALLLAALALAGCGKPDGPSRYDLSGKATFAGRPIPFGRILLEPDAARGNTGPGSVADIIDGHFQTRDGKGQVGGPHILTIHATERAKNETDEPASLFPPYQLTLDLPRETGQIDIEVPADAKNAKTAAH